MTESPEFWGNFPEEYFSALAKTCEIQADFRSFS